jgi:chromosome segregation protein
VAAAADEAQRLSGLCHGQLNRRLSQVEQAEAAVTDAVAEMSSALAGAAAEEERLGGLESRLRAAEQELTEASRRALATRGECESVDREYHALELDRREVEVKRESLEERATAELEFDLTQAYVPHRALREEEGFTPVDRAAAEAELGRLREEIRSLGAVNLEAIEEEGELSSQNDALAAQLADLDAARVQLQDLIADLDRRSLERFRATFEAVREHFAGPTGTFRKLFGGGSADLLLLPDENGQLDLLSCGVEIRAKPPGKEPRVLNQLSGGEKTMTAVALLMAIFQSKPSPFCVLDEVDAALDDANIDRYCRIVQEFLDRSHFIIITHNKRTMMGCDRLYGITMQERGVSKRVAVRLEQIGENGAIDRSALREPEPREAVADPSEPPLIETKPAARPRPARALVGETG